MKKYCPKGHLFDTGIYGDQCPMCATANKAGAQQGKRLTTNISGPEDAMSGGDEDHTRIATASARRAPAPTPAPAPAGVEGATRVRPTAQAPQAQAPVQPQVPARPAAPAQAPAAAPAQAPRMGTVIRHVGNTPAINGSQGRRLVGFLVTYNRTPLGKAYNLYEGRNFIGRDANNDISVPDDSMMSSRHMSILYRVADDKFKFRDEQSSNGTYVNKTLVDDGELQAFDIIRAGSTIFIFIPIPQIG